MREDLCSYEHMTLVQHLKMCLHRGCDSDGCEAYCSRQSCWVALSQQVCVCHSWGDCAGETPEVLWCREEGLALAVVGPLGFEPGLALAVGSCCPSCLGGLEDSLPREPLPSTSPLLLGSMKLSIATASKAAHRADQSSPRASPRLDYRRREAWWKGTVFAGDELQCFLAAADPSFLSFQTLGGSSWAAQDLGVPYREEEEIWATTPSAVEALAAFFSSSPLRPHGVPLVRGGVDSGPRLHECPLPWMTVARSALPCSKEVNSLGVQGGIRTRRCWAELLYNWDGSQGSLFSC